MSHRFIIEGQKKLGLNVTVAVEGVDDYEVIGWPWGSLAWALFGIAALAVELILISGLPYYNIDAVMTLGAPDLFRRPRLECRYTGPQGHRSAWFEDTDDCPAIVFLPWRFSTAAPAPVPSPITAPPANPDRHPRSRSLDSPQAQPKLPWRQEEGTPGRWPIG